MPPLRKLLLWSGAVLGVAVVAGAVVLETRYRVVRKAERVDRAVLLGGASVRGVVDPKKVQPILAEIAAEELGRAVPEWAVDWFMPYEAGAVAQLNFDAHVVELDLYLNAPRLDPELARRGRRLNLRQRLSGIDWADEGVAATEPGLLRLRGTIAMEPDAEDAFWYTWNQSFRPPPLALENGHFVEVVLDNRRGAAYLAFASLLAAFDIELDAKYQDISLSSLQFVEAVRLTIDPTPSGALGIRMTMAIAPDAIDRLGVVNMKVGIEDAFAELGARLDRQGLTLRGAGEWTDTGIVYEYRLDDAKKAIRLGMRGDLF